MLLYWIKNRSLLTILINVILVGLVCLVFINPNIKTYGENRLATSVYSDSEINYDIPSPTPEQLKDIAELDFVDKVFGYYYTELSITVGNKNVKTKIIFSDCLESIEFTMYNDSRLIESSLETFANPIYVDYEFATKNNVSLGDTIVFNEIEFQVAKIYETNTYYTSAIFAPLVGAQKDFILSKSKSYSGAYLKVNDIAKAEAFLKNYKPLGRLKDRESFSSEEAYQSHYDSWNSANYYNEITNFDEKLSNANVKTSFSNVIAYLVTGLVLIISNLVLMFRKSEIKYFKSRKDKKSVKLYYIVNEFISVLIFGACAFLMFALAKNNTIYIPENVIVEGYVGLAITIVCSVLVNSIIDIFLYKNKIIN